MSPIVKYAPSVGLLGLVALGLTFSHTPALVAGVFSFCGGIMTAALYRCK
jgi:hypothetical protein